VNHSMFWRSMSPDGGGQPDGRLAAAIDESFGSFGEFQPMFNSAAATRFGSGWAWLCLDQEGKLAVTSTPNQDNPVAQGLIPLLGLDVWEHAYYLKYQNRRPEYVSAWWNVVNWDEVSRQYALAQVGQGIGHVKNWVENTWKKIEEGWRNP